MVVQKVGDFRHASLYAYYAKLPDWDSPVWLYRKRLELERLRVAAT